MRRGKTRTLDCAMPSHRELLGFPSVLGAMLVGFAFDSWWLGVGIVVLSLYPYDRAYAAYFSDSPHHPRRRYWNKRAIPGRSNRFLARCSVGSPRPPVCMARNLS